MRNKFILSVISLFVFSIVNAQNVSMQPGKKNVLIEDFTGFKCGNCPDGHEVVNKIKLSHPAEVFPISVHAGPYAKTNAADQPNFIVDESTEIHDYFGISSYPSGMVNRRSIGMAGLIQGRSYWLSSSRLINREDADVNIWVSSSYDKNSGVVTTDVELYYINNVEDGQSSLCVSLLQNSILGPQAGGNMEDEYPHNHVLRDMFTPTWGETIEKSEKGTLVTKHYEYVMPEVIGNIDTDPIHSEIVAYVINSDKEVMNVSGCRVDCPDMSLPVKATLENYKIAPSRNYGFNFMECYLVNEGTEPLTSATFTLTFDDEDVVDCSWNAADGEQVECLERGYVKFPVELPSAVKKSGCDYKIKLTGLNGKSFSGNTIKGSFGAMINVNGDLKAIFKTDNFADDNTFRILDADGNIVTEYGPYEEGVAESHEEAISFSESGIYCLEVADAWGNGILSPRGSLKIYDAGGGLLLSNNDILDFGYRAFFNYSQTDGIESVMTDEGRLENLDMYNVIGQKVNENAKGIIIINGKKYLNNK